MTTVLKVIRRMIDMASDRRSIVAHFRVTPKLEIREEMTSERVLVAHNKLATRDSVESAAVTTSEEAATNGDLKEIIHERVSEAALKSIPEQ